jgi:hypothetical protein
MLVLGGSIPSVLHFRAYLHAPPPSSHPAPQLSKGTSDPQTPHIGPRNIWTTFPNVTPLLGRSTGAAGHSKGRGATCGCAIDLLIASAR